MGIKSCQKKIYRNWKNEIFEINSQKSKEWFQSRNLSITKNQKYIEKMIKLFKYSICFYCNLIKIFADTLNKFIYLLYLVKKCMQCKIPSLLQLMLSVFSTKVILLQILQNVQHNQYLN